jgi:anti-sigma regulatory factor (Ser/Thr protein kinase)
LPAARPREAAPLSESGRGLAIVSRLADRIEINCRDDDGCCVQARLDMRRAS